MAAALIIACGESNDDLQEVSVTSSALSGCDEMVPANRNVDGIPAYAQCAATENSAIYSNNGVDTSVTSLGSDWVRTQSSGGYQCTELAHRYLYFKWNVKWVPNGNAGQWCDTQPPANSGLTQTMAPVHGDLMVLANGSCGASSTSGHVVVIDVVDPAGARLTVVEQNGARRGTYQQSCGKCFLHVVANNAAAGAAPSGGSGGAAAPSGGSSAAAGAPGPITAGIRAPVPMPSLPPDNIPRAGGPAVSAAAGAAASPAPLATNAPTPAATPSTAGASSPTLSGSPRSRDGASATSSCSVARVRGSRPIDNAFALLALGWVTLCSRRRKRAKLETLRASGLVRSARVSRRLR
jgi:hypothetical protein